MLFIMDALDPLSDDVLKAAADELTEALKGLSPDVKVARKVIRKPS